MPDTWKDRVEEFCERYNIPLIHLSETMNEPKVIPMLRGKAFEFSVMMALQDVLPTQEWTVSHPTINAQSGLHDVDVSVLHRSTGKEIRLECKLAKKGSFRGFKDGRSRITVKCMRSRTLGEKMVLSLAPQWGVSVDALRVHNDQYLPQDFDVVATSIGNSFYETADSGIFLWQPTTAGEQFLHRIGAPSGEKLKDFAFRQIYLARSADIYIASSNGVVCTRRRCNNPTGCGFIPNYPVINYGCAKNLPTNGWVPLSDASTFFQRFLSGH